ncbi:hypothetical protein AB0G02_20560, partial [Actinosynnema sp. NPDC023658]|uniref:hypothetical protein n=1 Tax=Actinosynnema sp. NPDC023658 TaxID=3155465 RepID=UPI0033D125ED
MFAKSVVLAVVVLLGAATLTPASAAPRSGWHDLGWGLPSLQDTRSVPGVGDQPRPVPRAESAERALTAPPEAR